MKLALTMAWMGCWPRATGVAVLAAAMVRVCIASADAVVVDWELTSSKLMRGPRRELRACREVLSCSARCSVV